MHISRRLIVAVFVAMAGSAAAADADFSGLAALPMPKAEPGVETATPAEPTWCDGVEASGSSPDGLKRTIEAGEKNWRSFITALPIACQWPKEPAVQRAVAVIAQNWMNYTGLTQARALEVLALRAQTTKFDDDKKRLCAELAIPDETEGADKLFMQARRKLFGCGGEALWLTGESLGGIARAGDGPLGGEIAARPRRYRDRQSRHPHDGRAGTAQLRIVDAEECRQQATLALRQQLRRPALQILLHPRRIPADRPRQRGERRSIPFDQRSQRRPLPRSVLSRLVHE